jgi:hypothetical protein
MLAKYFFEFYPPFGSLINLLYSYVNRWCHFFICPLFNPTSQDKEVIAVNAGGLFTFFFKRLCHLPYTPIRTR